MKGSLELTALMHNKELRGAVGGEPGRHQLLRNVVGLPCLHKAHSMPAGAAIHDRQRYVILPGCILQVLQVLADHLAEPKRSSPH